MADFFAYWTIQMSLLIQVEEAIVGMVLLILEKNVTVEAFKNARITMIAVIQLHVVLNKKPNVPRVNAVMWLPAR